MACSRGDRAFAMLEPHTAQSDASQREPVMEVASVHKYLRPASAYGWSDADAEVWAAMVKERDAAHVSSA